MELIEHTAITFHTSPSLWLRYVDDTFCILNKNHMNDFHTHRNSTCSHFQFTIEKEHHFSLPFFDVLVKRSGSITTRTDFYLPQCTENPRTLTDIFTAFHITPNIRSSLLPKLYSAGLTHTSQIKHGSRTVNTQYLATKWVSYQNHFSNF